MQNLPILERLMPNIPNMNQNQPKEDEQILQMREEYFNQVKSNDEEMENFRITSKKMLQMGVSQRLILHSFLVYRYRTPEEGLEILSKNDQDLWTHRFVNCNWKCFICNEDESGHLSLELKLKRKSTIEKDLMLMKKRTSIMIQEIENSENLRVASEQCDICFGELEPGNKYTLTCTHEYCKECIVYYIEEEIKNARVEKITCPQKSCDFEFQAEEVKSLIDSSVYYKYQKFLARAKLKGNKDLVTCPIVDCEGVADLKRQEGIDASENLIVLSANPSNPRDEQNVILSVNEEPDKRKKPGRRLVCDKGHPFCLNCMKAWHGEAACEEDAEIKDYATFSGTIVKKCPNCKVWTEKNEGCNHMTCRECNYNWCWLCEKECPSDHYTKRGTPCFGKMFGDQEDPNVELLILINSYSTLFSFFFIYLIFFYIISSSIRRSFYQNDGTRRTANAPPRLAVFCALVFIMVLFLVCILFFNGYFLILMCTNMTDVRNNFAKCMMVMTNLVLWIVYFFTGMVFSLIWFFVCMGYTIVKLICV